MRTAMFITFVMVFSFLALLVALFLASSATGFRGLGIVVIGPIPIVIDVSDPKSLPLLLIPFIAVALAFFTLVLKNRKRARLRLE